MLIHIIRYLKGYVVIKVCGFSPERFLNLCSNHNIFVWDIVNSGNCYEMKMSVAGFKRIRPLVRKTRTKIMILEKHGLSFFIFRNRKRKSFFIGMALCICMLYVMSLFVWDITIEGCRQYTPDVLMDFLEENDIEHGMRKSRVNGEDIQFLLRNEYPKITWASVSVEGTRLMVRIKENTITGDEETDFGENQTLPPMDMTAPASGIIKSMIVRKGTPMKQIGDVVEKGDILVSGRLELLNDSKEVEKYEYCISDGDILIEYQETYKKKLNRSYKKQVFSGHEKWGLFVTLSGRRLFLNQNPDKFSAYDTVTVNHRLKLLDNYYLPVSFGSTKYREYVLEDWKYTDEELKNLLQQTIEQDFRDLEKKGVQIIENNVKIQIGQNQGSASGVLIVQEAATELVPTEILTGPAPTILPEDD